MKPRPSLRRYATPLGTLRSSRARARIVPMWPPGADVASVRSDFQRRRRERRAATMLAELWPHGESAFDLYEDDGVTRAALSSATDGPDGAFVVDPPLVRRAARLAARRRAERRADADRARRAHRGRRLRGPR